MAGHTAVSNYDCTNLTEKNVIVSIKGETKMGAVQKRIIVALLKKDFA